MKRQFIEMTEENLLNASICLVNKITYLVIPDFTSALTKDEIFSAFNGYYDELNRWIEWLNMYDELPVGDTLYPVSNAADYMWMIYFEHSYSTHEVIRGINENQNINENDKIELINKWNATQPLGIELWNIFSSKVNIKKEINQQEINKLKHKIMSNIKKTPDFEKSCIVPTDVAPTPPSLDQQTVQQIVDCINNAIAIIIANTPTMPQSGIRFRHRVRRSNIDIIQATAEFAANHPDTVNPTLDVDDWLKTLENIRLVAPIEDKLSQLTTVLDNFNLIESIVAFEDFRNYYVCVKILAEKGFPEAVQIWPVMKQIWDHLRGRTWTLECPVGEVINTLNQANIVISKNKPALLEALKSEKLLEGNLHHFIHEQDHITDQDEHNR